jgi:hypothetical protein
VSKSFRIGLVVTLAMIVSACGGSSSDSRDATVTGGDVASNDAADNPGPAAAAATGQVPNGVYDCYGTGLAEGDTIGHGATQLNVSGGKFSVVGADAYLSRGGATGHFSFDGLTLAMIDGPYAGMRYHKVADWSFRQLMEDGQEGPVMCPLNTAKDANSPNLW